MSTDVSTNKAEDSIASPRSEQTAARIFTSFPGSQYLFPSDELEKGCLTRQHYMLKRLFEDRILLAPVSLHPGDKVLDSGTGTGVWLFDLADNVPNSVRMYGIDIESRLFPSSSEDLPNTITFSIESNLSLPLEWKDTFALVHQRLLFGGLQLKTEWPKAIQEIYRVLAPGGWVQLLEVGDSRSGLVHERFIRLLIALLDMHGLALEASKHIPQMLTDAGYVNMHSEKQKCLTGNWAGADGIQARNNLLELWRSIKPHFMKVGGLVSSGEEYDQMLADLEKEYDQTPGAFVEWVIIYTQKPV